MAKNQYKPTSSNLLLSKINGMGDATSISDFPESGTIDVVANYPWSLSYPIQNEALNGVPYINLIEYEQDWSDIRASLNYWYNQITQKDQATLTPF